MSCLAQVSASVALLTLASHTRSAIVLAACATAFAVVGQMGFCLIHEAEHNKLHPTPFWNEGLGTAMSVFFPASYHLLKIGHLIHHRRNRSDAELLDYFRPGERRWVKSLQYYLLICGAFWVMVVLSSVAVCCLPESLTSRRRPRPGDGIFAQYAQLLRHVKIPRVRLEVAMTVGVWIAGFRWLGWNAAAVAWCGAAFGFFWSNQQYIYHVRTPRHPREGAVDLRLGWPLRAVYFNFNYHLTHHRDVRIPWIDLPRAARTLPRVAYFDAYLRLWKPPRPISEAWPVDHQAFGPLPSRDGNAG